MIKLTLAKQNSLKIKMGKADEKDIKFSVLPYIQGSGQLPYYEGDYEVEPDFVKQTLPTKNKSMAEDVLVLEIPVHEVTNDYGTTYIVGGI